MLVTSINELKLSKLNKVRSESRCALINGVESDVHVRLYRPDTV
jgi:hypothetical protein